MKQYPKLFITLLIVGIILFANLIGFDEFINLSNSNIEANYFVLAVGIDNATTEENKVRLTIVSEQFSSDPSSNVKKTNLISSEGLTIFDAVRNFNTFVDKKIFWGHLGYIIIGEEIAQDNILDFLDFFIRDHQVRYTSLIAVSKESTAEELLKSANTNNIFVPDMLDGLFKNAKQISISQEKNLGDVIKSFGLKYSDIYVPYICIEEENLFDSKKTENSNLKKNNEDNGSENSDSESNNNENSEGDSPATQSDYTLSLKGFALFDKTKLIGYLSENDARGLNWIVDEVYSSVIIIQDNKRK